MSEECILQPACDRGAGGESLDGLYDPVSLDLADGDETAANQASIQQHRAGAAIARVAADFRACQAELVAQNLGQPRALRRASPGPADR